MGHQSGELIHYPEFKLWNNNNYLISSKAGKKVSKPNGSTPSKCCNVMNIICIVLAILMAIGIVAVAIVVPILLTRSKWRLQIFTLPIFLLPLVSYSSNLLFTWMLSLIISAILRHFFFDYAFIIVTLGSAYNDDRMTSANTPDTIIACTYTCSILVRN